jgi:sulfide:quinone oxidoreductase
MQLLPCHICYFQLLANNRFIVLDKNLLQHRRYSNIFSLGPSPGLPAEKNQADFCKKTPIVAANLPVLTEGKSIPGNYNIHPVP